MGIGRSLAAVLIVLLPCAVAAAEQSVTRFRLSADTSNTASCRALDAVLARPHTVTVNEGDVEITSAGGIEGRMNEARPAVYRVAFELSGMQLDVVADLTQALVLWWPSGTAWVVHGTSQSSNHLDAA